MHELININYTLNAKQYALDKSICQMHKTNKKILKKFLDIRRLKTIQEHFMEPNVMKIIQMYFKFFLIIGENG